MRCWWPIGVALAVSLLAAACDEERKPGAWRVAPAPDSGDFDAGILDGAPPPDAPGYCGNEFHTPAYRPPNVYFVFDRSGSMSDEANDDGETRFEVVRGAALGLVRTLGPLISVGAAVLPQGPLDTDPCTPGEQVFPVTRGDPVTGVDGPTTRGFAWATNLSPRGGTPVATTLAAIYDELRIVRGNTVVLLATDGAPNCNVAIACTIDECIPNIEGLCGPEEDCCAVGSRGGPQNCIDRAATLAAIDRIRSLGVETYVVGIPGSAIFGDVLDAMAVAGGTAQAGEHQYYAVDDLGALGEVFAAIAAEAIACEFVLADPPEGRDMTNVYLDGVVVPYDAEDGWSWLGEGASAIGLFGEACARLESGDATTVQVVTGCPTETPQ